MEAETTKTYRRNRWGGLSIKYRSEYGAWLKMNVRCHRPEHKDFKYYGARGITVCKEWRDSFLAFFNHIGPKPHRSLSLDRINNDRGYVPGNVHWATRLHQNRNKRQFKHCTDIVYATPYPHAPAS